MGAFCARSAEASLTSCWTDGDRDRCDRLVRLCSAFAVGFSLLILLGWACDLTLLKSGLTGQTATQPLAAVCFALCALSLGLSTEPRRWHYVLARGGAGLVLLIAGATFCQNALDTDWGLDRLMFSDAVLHEQTGSVLRPGRPAAGVLVVVALLCCCLLLCRARSAAGRRVYIGLATGSALFSATIVLAYAFSVHALYAMGFYAQVGLNSGIGLAILSFGVLLRRPDLGWMGVLSGSSVGAVSSRRMLVWSGSLLLMLAAIVRVGASASLYGAEFELTLFAVGSLGVLLAGLLAHARRVNSLENARRSMASELEATETHRDELLSTLAHELRNPLAPLRNGIEIVCRTSKSDPVLNRTAQMMVRQMAELVRVADKLPGTSSSGRAPPQTAEKPPFPNGLVERMRLRILVADDNTDGAASLAMLLQLEGHEVCTAPDGRRAVELAEVFRPNVILMDLGMPHLDGIGATRQIRASSWGQRAVIVAVTALGGDSERRRTREAGMDFHLIKPVDFRALAAILAPGESFNLR